MCMHYKYFLQVKPEYDLKFMTTGVHSQFQYLCEVEDVQKGIVKLNYDKKRFNLIVKECGQCRICRQKRAMIKACQTQCEYKTVGKGSFVTLTFGHDKIKEYLNTSKRYKNWSNYKKNKYLHYLQWTLEKREFQLFMKRLRKEYLNKERKEYCFLHNMFDCIYKKDGSERQQVLFPNWCTSLAVKPEFKFKPTKIRFLHAGEYGCLKERPHHHAIILGVDFSFDKTFARYSWKQKRNVILHHNNFLSNLWQFGEVTVDKVNYQACNYVARYITKKTVNDTKAKKKYDIQNSMLLGRLPEYSTCSNRPGLGYDYFVRYAEKIISDEHLYFRNQKGEFKESPLPNYYKVLMKRLYPDKYRLYRKKSLDKQLEFSEKTPDELLSRMRDDRDSVKKTYQYFVGNFEQSIQSLKELNTYNFSLKREIFNDLNDIGKIYKASFSDSGFIEQENWRIRCFRNFEKYRRNLRKNAFNYYVIKKNNMLKKYYKRNHVRINPQFKQSQLLKSNLVTEYQSNKMVVDLLDNPFSVDNLDYYKPKTEEWLNYERSYA